MPVVCNSQTDYRQLWHQIWPQVQHLRQCSWHFKTSGDQCSLCCCNTAIPDYVWFCKFKKYGWCVNAELFIWWLLILLSNAAFVCASLKRDTQMCGSVCLSVHVYVHLWRETHSCFVLVVEFILSQVNGSSLISVTEDFPTFCTKLSMSEHWTTQYSHLQFLLKLCIFWLWIQYKR